MNFWSYFLGPTGPTLGPMALQGIFVGFVLTISGIAIIQVPEKIQRHRHMSKKAKGGIQEGTTRVEFRVKVGVLMISWGSAFMLALLLRIFGTPGLDTHFLPVLVVLLLPFIMSYVVFYRLLFYRRYVILAGRIDQQNQYHMAAKKQKKKDDTAKRQHIALLPGKAMVGLFTAPIIYYVAMITVAIPLGLPASNHDHLLHQFGMMVMVPLGYAIGLLFSLGDAMHEHARWLIPPKR